MGGMSLVNMIRGWSQQGRARKFENEYNRLDKALQPVSPQMMDYVNRVRSMEQGMSRNALAMRRGTDPASVAARRSLSQGLSYASENIARLGGSVGDLQKAYSGYARGVGDIYGQSSSNALGMQQQASQLALAQYPMIQSMDMQRYSLARDRRNRAMAQQAQWQTAAYDSFGAALGGAAAAADYAYGQES